MLGHNPQDSLIPSEPPQEPLSSSAIAQLMGDLPMSQGQNVSGSAQPQKSGLLKALLHRMF
jgi:hypothetical protein